MNRMQKFIDQANRYKKPIIIALLMTIIAGVLFGTVRAIFFVNKAEIAERPALEIDAAKITKDDVDITFNVMGTVSYREKVTISSKILGRVDKIFVEQGDTVYRGKVLAKIETLPLELDLKSAEADLKTAKAGFNLAKEKVKRAEQNIEREIKLIDKTKIDSRDKYSTLQNSESLYQKKKELNKIGGVTDTELDAIKTKYITDLSNFLGSKKNQEIQMVGYRKKDIKAAGLEVPKNKKEKDALIKMLNTGVEKAEVEAALSNVKKIETEIEKLKTNIREATIKAPMDGVVAVRNIEVGEQVKQDTDLFVLMNVKNVFVIANVNEKEITKLKRNQQVQFAVDAVAGKKFSGEIFLISPILDTETRTVEVKILTKNPEGLLKPGMFARAVVTTERVNGMIQAPSTSIIKDSQDTHVFVIKNGIAFKKKIEIGRTISDKIEIVSGITEQDTIATSNVGMLIDGMKVRVLKPTIGTKS